MTRNPRILTPASAILFCALAMVSLAACDSPEPDSNEGGCTETITVLALDELTPEFEDGLGGMVSFTAADVLASVAGSYSERLAWIDWGEAPSLIIEIQHLGGEARYHDLSIAPSSEESIDRAAPICDDRVEIDVQVSMTTGDGRLAEAFDVALVSTDGVGGTFSLGELQPADLAGSYDFIALSPMDYDHVSTRIEAIFRDGQTWGTVTERATSTIGDGLDAEDSITNEDVGSWPADGPIDG
jgi:hypothetical protein